MVGTRIAKGTFWVGAMASLVLAQVIAAAPQAVRPIGAVTEINAQQLTLRTDAGPLLTVHLPANVEVLRVPPGAKNLSAAEKVAVSDINPGDRVLVLGSLSADQKSMVASRVIDMSKAALARAHEAQRQAWEHRGISGVVQSLDPAGPSLVLAVPNTPPTPSNPTHPVAVTLKPGARLLRYAPDSIKFSDARPAPFADIKVGDQVRALGEKNSDGSALAAQEVVSGTFRNIPATVISVDAAQGTLTVKDLQTGKPVLVKTNPDSKLHELPPFIAMMIARFNSDGSNGANSSGASGAEPKPSEPQGGTFRRPEGPAGNHQGMRGGAPGDFNAMLDHTPALSLSDLKAGEPLIVVSTEGAQPGEVTAIAVLSGVEPILRARPKGSQEVRLGPWNMSMGGGGGSSAETGGEPGP